MVLVVRVRVGSERFVPRRIPVVDLIPPIVNAVLGDDRCHGLVADESFC